MALKSSAHGFAGALGGAASMTLLYPLENLRMRMQVAHGEKSRLQTQSTAETHALATFKGPLDCIQHVVKHEGWKGFYTGLGSAVFGISMSSYTYFWWYSFFKDRWLLLRHRKSLEAVDNIAVAGVAGVVNCFCTVPLWVANARITLAKQNNEKFHSITHALQTIYKESGVAGLYKGLGPALALVINPIIQFVTYEQLTRFFMAIQTKRLQRTKPGGTVWRLTASEYFLLGALAKALATILTYPLQVIKARLQAKDYSYKGPVDAARRMLQEEGPSVFFQGLAPKFVQTVLNSAFMFAAYEKLLQLSLRVLRLLFNNQ